jgi:choline dehydrogenase
LNRRGEKFLVDVGDELILSAGAIQSPQLLMLSGVGNADTLREVSIPLTQHVQGVGDNLQDHPAWCFNYGATDPRDSLASKMGYFGRLKIGIEWLLGRRGLGISNHFEVGAFFTYLLNTFSFFYQYGQ